MASSCIATEERSLKTAHHLYKQKTLSDVIKVKGKGLFTGENAAMSIYPSEANQGIVFQRIDLPNKPLIPAKVDYVVQTPRCTVIGNEGASISTVEHFLSALKGLGIDNAFIELSGPEVPILDGSAREFVQMIQECGTQEQDIEKMQMCLSEPVFFSHRHAQIVALPSNHFEISFTVSFPKSKLIGSQFLHFEIDEETYISQIASARTFSIYEEIKLFLDKGLIKGGGMENAVIIKEDQVVNPEGLRYDDEMVRHKMLDLIGDLALIPVNFVGHIIAICSGHETNVAFGKKLCEKLLIGSEKGVQCQQPF